MLQKQKQAPDPFSAPKKADAKAGTAEAPVAQEALAAADKALADAETERQAAQNKAPAKKKGHYCCGVWVED